MKGILQHNLKWTWPPQQMAGDASPPHAPPLCFLKGCVCKSSTASGWPESYTYTLSGSSCFCPWKKQARVGISLLRLPPKGTELLPAGSLAGHGGNSGQPGCSQLTAPRVLELSLPGAWPPEIASCRQCCVGWRLGTGVRNPWTVLAQRVGEAGMG